MFKPRVSRLVQGRGMTRWALALLMGVGLTGCGSTFRALYTSAPFEERQLQQLQSAAEASGFSVKERSPGFLGVKTPATVITFSNRKQRLVASCFDSRNLNDCDAVVRSLMQRAGISGSIVMALDE